jgi:hypothetical protein
MQNAPNVFGDTVGQVQVRLREISDGTGGWMTGDRDHLTVEQSAHLSAQLPTIVRGKARIPDPKDVARTVYRVLHRHISVGESEKVYNGLPAYIRKYWPARRVYGELETTAGKASR